MAVQFSTTGKGEVGIAGTISISFTQPTAPTVWIGTVSVPTAPVGVIWTVTLGGRRIASIAGRSSYGPISIGAGEQLTITASNLVPGVSYTAWLVGERTTTTTSSVPGSIAATPSLLLASAGLVGVTNLRVIRVELTKGVSSNFFKWLPAQKGVIYRLWQWGLSIHETTGFTKTAQASLYAATITSIESVTYPYHPSSNALAGLQTTYFGYLAKTPTSPGGLFNLTAVYSITSQ